MLNVTRVLVFLSFLIAIALQFDNYTATLLNGNDRLLKWSLHHSVQMQLRWILAHTIEDKIPLFMQLTFW